MHGANRLGANSLLDIVVFGRACAHHIKETLTPGKPHKEIPAEAGLQSVEFLDTIRLVAFLPRASLERSLMGFVGFDRKSDGPLPTAKIRLDMQKAMQADAAVFRCVILFMFSLVWHGLNVGRSTQESLDQGVQKLRAIYKSFDNVGIKDRSMIWNS